MGHGEAMRPGRLRSVSYSAAQTRVIEAALVLFAEHGVGGTSLQMIADAIGVTKAAVYHQFKTKEEIVLAAAEVVLASLEEAVEAAEAERSRSRAREVMIAGMVDAAIERRRVVSILQRDPVMVRFLEEHEPFRRVMERLYRVLIGAHAGAGARVAAAMLSAAIAGAVIHPLAVDLDDATLRAHLVKLARRFLRLLA
jgi:AcrR family transcriptional regulator